MATYLADRVVVYTGRPSIEATATAPQGLLSGMNQFLRQLEITFRRDPTNYRPRINKGGSIKDREDRKGGAGRFSHFRAMILELVYTNYPTHSATS